MNRAASSRPSSRARPFARIAREKVAECRAVAPGERKFERPGGGGGGGVAVEEGEWQRTSSEAHRANVPRAWSRRNAAEAVAPRSMHVSAPKFAASSTPERRFPVPDFPAECDSPEENARARWCEGRRRRHARAAPQCLRACAYLRRRGPGNARSENSPRDSGSRAHFP